MFDCTSERSNQSATHQMGGTLFDCMATLPSGDWALHCSAEVMPLSASSPSGTQCHLPTQQPAAQTQPTAPFLPVISSTVTSSAANQLSQQATASPFPSQRPSDKFSDATHTLVIMSFLPQLITHYCTTIKTSINICIYVGTIVVIL